jgi:hypothetical protein
MKIWNPEYVNIEDVIERNAHPEHLLAGHKDLVRRFIIFCNEGAFTIA